MSEYNIQMNKYNALNAEYDQLYPATKIENIDGLDTALQNKTPILQQIPLIYLTPENMIDVSEGTISLSKVGNMVMFTLNIQPKSGKLEYNKIYAVLPEGYRPIKSFTFPSDNGMGTSIYSEIDVSGNLRFYSDVNTSFISAELMYFSV